MLPQGPGKDLDVSLPPAIPLRLTNTAPGKPIKPGTELRILAVGDSITYGFLSDQDGGDGNGYRLRVRQYLSKDKVVYAGTETSPTGNMTDGYFAAWNGKTIQYIADHTKVFESLVPKVVAHRVQAGKHVLAVDFSTFGLGNLRDCIHPTNQGYHLVGYYWYDFIAQIPQDWIATPVGKNPKREEKHMQFDIAQLGKMQTKFKTIKTTSCSTNS
ncbi:GDSL-like Lipase/Acylhydrolase [Trichoderma compactum]